MCMELNLRFRCSLLSRPEVSCARERNRQHAAKFGQNNSRCEPWDYTHTSSLCTGQRTIVLNVPSLAAGSSSYVCIAELQEANQKLEQRRGGRGVNCGDREIERLCSSCVLTGTRSCCVTNHWPEKSDQQRSPAAKSFRSVQFVS